MQAVVDIGGVFDPTPTLDIFGASMSAESGDYLGASASILGAVLPYAGDLAKTGKIAKGLNVIDEAIKVGKTEKKGTGSYTITFENGMKYHGKGPESRMNKSANERATKNNPVKSKDWTPAKNDRDAFKQESERLENDGGHRSNTNYNKRDSPGTKYRKQDGD